MNTATALTWSWLNILTKKRADVLTEIYGSLEDALGSLDENLLKSLGCREETIYKTLNRLEEFDPSAYQKELEKREISFITIDDPQYPALLRTIPDPPLFLYAKGDLSILSQPCIALVGTREMTPYGHQVSERFASAFVKSDVVTVSGLALGVDAAIAEETIRSGGHTVAVLGHGLANIFPKTNAKIGEKILYSGGLLLTEFPLDAMPDKHTFPARNRIIAGLSIATVVIEAGERSGALITAEFALEDGRDVFAVPGSILESSSDGCNHLIAKGSAHLALGPEDVLTSLSIVASERSSGQISESSSPIAQYLSSLPQSIDDLIEKSGLTAQNINTELTMMELDGAAKRMNDGRWVRA